MTKTNIAIRLILICIGFFVVSKGASIAFNMVVEDPLTSMMLTKWVTVVYVVGLVYWLKISSEVGLTFDRSLKTLSLYWPVALIAILSLAGGWQSTEVSLLINIALLAIAVGIGEEVIFRGFFFYYLRQMQPVSIILISSIAFGFMHLPGIFANIPTDVVLAQVYFAAGIGMVFGNARARFRCLTIPIFVHAAFDFVALGAKGSIEEMLVYDEQIVFGMLFAGTITWAWGIWLLFVGKRRNSFAQLAAES